MFAVSALALFFCTTCAAHGHDIYTGIKNKLGYDCCGGEHCTPISGSRIVPAVLQGFRGYRIDGRWFVGENSTLPSPDERFHICWSHPAHIGTRYISCFFAPVVGM